MPVAAATVVILYCTCIRMDTARAVKHNRVLREGKLTGPFMKRGLAGSGWAGHRRRESPKENSFAFTLLRHNDYGSRTTTICPQQFLRCVPVFGVLRTMIRFGKLPKLLQFPTSYVAREPMSRCRLLKRVVGLRTRTLLSTVEERSDGIEQSTVIGGEGRVVHRVLPSRAFAVVCRLPTHSGM